MKCYITCLTLFVLVAAADAKADDLVPAPFRGDPGSTFVHWTYDENAPNPVVFPRNDVPDVSSFVPGGPGFVDPAITFGADPTIPTDFAAQLFAGSQFEPDVPPTWLPVFNGRFGVLRNVLGASWDINNFVDLAPLKKVHIQITWAATDPTVVPDVFFTEAEFFQADPEIEGFEEFEIDPFENSIDLGDGWIHSTFTFELRPNPDAEFIGIFPFDSTTDTGVQIAIDQIVIETISTVPEPATFGLACFAMVAVLMKGRHRRE